MNNACVTLMLCTVTIVAGMLVAAPPTDDLEAKALAAMQEGQYENARELLQEIIEAQPDAPSVRYNLACCNSRLDNVEEAEQHLLHAWESGFKDLEFMRNDPDLKAVRQTKSGQRLLRGFDDELKREKRLHGEALLFDAQIVASSRIVTPEKLQNGKKYPLVVLLHGHGGSADNIVGIFSAAGLSPNFIVLAPSGPYAVPSNNHIGYSWYPPPWLYKEIVAGYAKLGETEGSRRRRWFDDHENQVSRNYVIAAIDKVSTTYPIDPERIILVGHSEGGVLAYELGLSHSDRFRGLAAIGSRLRQTDTTPEQLKRAAGDIRILVCHSPDDEAIAFDKGKKAYQQFRNAGFESRLLRYSGGHGLTVELIRELKSWIDTTAKR